MAAQELGARLDNLLATAQIETANVDLYAPIAEKEECPVCMLPVPLNGNETLFMVCCGHMICRGCVYKNLKTHIEDRRTTLNQLGPGASCAFCRQPPPKNDTKYTKSLKKQMKLNNGIAYLQMSERHRLGTGGVLQSDAKSLEMRIRAAELGNVEAYERIGQAYKEGIAVEENMSKAVEFYEVGAKKGSVHAHKELALFHMGNGDTQASRNYQRCIKHWKVAASAGHQDGMDILMVAYRNKGLSKEELAETLRAFQSSSNEMKSEDRDFARMIEATR